MKIQKIDALSPKIRQARLHACCLILSGVCFIINFPMANPRIPAFHNGQFLSGFAWNHAAKFAEYALVYCFSVIVSRALGPYEYGIYATLLSAAQFIPLLASAGVDLALNRFLPQYGADAEGSARRAFLIRRLLFVKIILLLAAAAFLSSGWSTFTSWLHLQNAGRRYLIFICAFGFSRALVTFFTSVWLSHLKSKPVFFVNGSILVLQLAAILLLLPSGLALDQALAIVLAGAAATMFVQALLLRRTMFSSALPVPMKPVFSFSGILWLNAVTEYFYGKQGDVLLLGIFSVDKSSIGQYDVAHALSQVPVLAITAGLAGVSVSMFSRLTAGNAGTLPEFWSSLSKRITRYSLPLFVFGFVFAPDLLRVIYSASYMTAVPYLRALLLARGISRIFGGGENADAILALGKERSLLIIGLAGGTFNVILNLALIPICGALGAAIATGIATVGVNAASWALLRRVAGVIFPAMNWLACAALSLAPVLAFRWIFASPSFVQLILAGIGCIILWFAMQRWLLSSPEFKQ